MPLRDRSTPSTAAANGWAGWRTESDRDAAVSSSVGRRRSRALLSRAWWRPAARRSVAGTASTEYTHALRARATRDTRARALRSFSRCTRTRCICHTHPRRAPPHPDPRRARCALSLTGVRRCCGPPAGARHAPCRLVFLTLVARPRLPPPTTTTRAVCVANAFRLATHLGFVWRYDGEFGCARQTRSIRDLDRMLSYLIYKRKPAPEFRLCERPPAAPVTAHKPLGLLKHF